jgi:hypothetical protein
MKAVLFACAIVFSGFSAQAQSAFQLLRSHFRASDVPAPEQLLAGQTWACTGQLLGAKGLFPMVSVWDTDYRFKLQRQGHITNKGQRATLEFNYLEHSLVGEQECAQCEGRFDSLRVSREGHLLVEVIQAARRGDRLLPALTRPRMVVVQYLICENPYQHDSDRWFGETFRANPFDRAP